MSRIFYVPITMMILLGALACGAAAPAGPGEVAERMLRTAQDHDYESMNGCLSPEMQQEINEARMQGLEIISYSLDLIEYNSDSTEAEVEFTVTIRELDSGDTEVEEDDFELIRTPEGKWIIVEM